MPFTFEDIERIEIEKRKNRIKIEKRNAIIVYSIGVVVACIVALGVAHALGVL